MKTYSYPAIRIDQSGNSRPLILLAAKATEIDEWAGVPQKLRVIVDEEVNTELLGFQRDDDPDRVTQIAQFYANDSNVLQNPLLCAIRKAIGQEVTFIEDEDSSQGTVCSGRLEIRVTDRSKQRLIALFKEWL